MAISQLIRIKANDELKAESLDENFQYLDLKATNALNQASAVSSDVATKITNLINSDKTKDGTYSGNNTFDGDVTFNGKVTFNGDVTKLKVEDLSVTKSLTLSENLQQEYLKATFPNYSKRTSIASDYTATTNGYIMGYVFRGSAGTTTVTIDNNSFNVARTVSGDSSGETGFSYFFPIAKGSKVSWSGGSHTVYFVPVIGYIAPKESEV